MSQIIIAVGCTGVVVEIFLTILVGDLKVWIVFDLVSLCVIYCFLHYVLPSPFFLDSYLFLASTAALFIYILILWMFAHLLQFTMH